MLKALGNAFPAVNFLLRQNVDVVLNFLVANQKQMKLIFSAAVRTLGKILQEFCVFYSRMGNARFKIFSEFIVNDKNSVVFSAFAKFLADLLINIDNIKASKRIEFASRSERRIKFFKFLKKVRIII